MKVQLRRSAYFAPTIRGRRRHRWQHRQERAIMERLFQSFLDAHEEEIQQDVGTKLKNLMLYGTSEPTHEQQEGRVKR